MGFNLQIVILLQVIVVLITSIVTWMHYEGTMYDVRPVGGHIVGEHARWIIYWDLQLPNGNSCVMRDATSYDSETHAAVALPYLQNLSMKIVEASCPELRCMTPADWATCQEWRRSSDEYNPALIIVFIVFVQLFLFAHYIDTNSAMYQPLL